MLLRVVRLLHPFRSILSFASWTVLRVIILIALLFVYFWSSALSYLIFYYIYIPPISRIQPIHLQFQSHCNSYRPVCSFPQSIVRLREKEQLLMAGQEYSVAIHLHLPESEVNRQLGMFMVNISFMSANDQVLAMSGRHFMLRYQSRLVRYMSTLFYFLPLVLGFSEEKQVLSSEVLEAYVDDSSNPAEYVQVTVVSQHIEIYSSEIRFDARFSGLRYLMYYWPFTTGIYVICNMVLMKLLMTVLVWYLGSLAVQDRDPVDPVDERDEGMPDGHWQQPQRAAQDGHWMAAETLNPHGQNSVRVRPQFDLGDRDGVVPLDGSPVGHQHEESSSSTSGSQQMHRASSSASLTQLLAAQAARESPEPVIPRSVSTSSLLQSHRSTTISHGNREFDDGAGSRRDASLEPASEFFRHRAPLSETA